VQRRRRSANPTTSRGAARLLTAVGVFALLMLPVEYKAGAERAHPHAAFQLWADFAHGKTPHRHDDTPLGHAAHTVHEAPVAAAVEPPPDTPKVSEATPPAERAAAFASILALAWLLLPRGWPRIAGLASRLVGRSPRPAFPPPRLAALGV